MNGLYGYVGNAADYWTPFAPGLEWTRDWAVSTIYITNQLVRRDGSTYIALRSGYNHPPEGSPDYWELVATRGDVGAAGPAGPQGPTGETGAQGSIRPTGAMGPQGPAGVSGYEIVTTTIPGIDADSWSTTVTCRAGKVATGGGGSVGLDVGTGPIFVALTGSGPRNGANS